MVSLANLKCGWKGTGTSSAASSGEEQRGSRGKTRNKPLFTSYHPWAFCASLLSSLKEAFVTDEQILYDLFQKERRSFYLSPPSPFSQFGYNKYSPVLCPLPSPRPAVLGVGDTNTGDHRARRGSAPACPSPARRSRPLSPVLLALQAAASGSRQSFGVSVSGGCPQQCGRLPSPRAPAPHHCPGAQRKRTRCSIHPSIHVPIHPSSIHPPASAPRGPSVT